MSNTNTFTYKLVSQMSVNYPHYNNTALATGKYMLSMEKKMYCQPLFSNSGITPKLPD